MAISTGTVTACEWLVPPQTAARAQQRLQNVEKFRAWKKRTADNAGMQEQVSAEADARARALQKRHNDARPSAAERQRARDRGEVSAEADARARATKKRHNDARPSTAESQRARDRAKLGEGAGAPRFTSQYRGVCWDKRAQRWRATIRQKTENGQGGSKCSLGSYDLEQDAAEAYDAAALEVHGRKALLNFGCEEGGDDEQIDFADLQK